MRLFDVSPVQTIPSLVVLCFSLLLKPIAATAVLAVASLAAWFRAARKMMAPSGKRARHHKFVLNSSRVSHFSEVLRWHLDQAGADYEEVINSNPIPLALSPMRAARA